MQNLVLILHLLIALALILTVLLQRSEGGGLGIGGGGGNVTGRPAATPISKFTWILAIAFLVTSLSLNWLARNEAAQQSVIDRIGVEQGSSDPAAPPLPATDGLLTPPPVDVPAAPPPAD